MFKRKLFPNDLFVMLFHHFEFENIYWMSAFRCKQMLVIRHHSRAYAKRKINIKKLKKKITRWGGEGRDGLNNMKTCTNNFFKNTQKRILMISSHSEESIFLNHFSTPRIILQVLSYHMLRKAVFLNNMTLPFLFCKLLTLTLHHLMLGLT